MTPGAGSILVVGYGNTLRADDAAGPRVAAAVAAWDVPGLAVLAPQQLTPELAEPLAAARLALFVDARAGREGDETRVEPVAAATEAAGPTLGHTCDPAYLLALARALYGTGPEAAWLVTVPATDLGLGERLSSTARRGIEAALRRIAERIGHKDAEVAAP